MILKEQPSGLDAPFSGRQLRAARALAAISGEAFASESGVSLATLRRAEKTEGPVAMTRPVRRAILEALARHGVEMTREDGVSEGVRITRR